MKRILPLIILALFCSLLIACGSKVTKENAAKIKTGMTVAEVEGILGKSSDQKSTGAVAMGNNSAKTMTWTDGDKSITVNFLNDKVAGPIIEKGL